MLWKNKISIRVLRIKVLADVLFFCNKCSFRKTIEQYKSDRLKYRDKEIAYLAKHGITYRGD